MGLGRQRKAVRPNNTPYCIYGIVLYKYCHYRIDGVPTTPYRCTDDGLTDDKPQKGRVQSLDSEWCFVAPNEAPPLLRAYGVERGSFSSQVFGFDLGSLSLRPLAPITGPDGEPTGIRACRGGWSRSRHVVSSFHHRHDDDDDDDDDDNNAVPNLISSPPFVAVGAGWVS